jgi:hypothetical protein
MLRRLSKIDGNNKEHNFVFRFSAKFICAAIILIKYAFKRIMGDLYVKIKCSF